MKAACYCMTHNYYENIFPSLKSLLCNSDVDKVYLLIEDDDIGFELPDKVECINISDQKYFNKNGPNFRNKWAWIVLIRAALAKIFPDLDRLLTLDVDTLVVSDISDLWDMNIGKNYLAGAIDLPLARDGRIYVNAGVVLWNLKEIRAAGIDDKMIWELNHRHFEYPEQDCLNHVCEGHIYVLNGIYNSGAFSRDNGTPKLLHFAGRGLKKYFADSRVKEYKDLPWEVCEYRAQRPVNPGTPVKLKDNHAFCGTCDALLLVKKQKYCHECGTPIAW